MDWSDFASAALPKLDDYESSGFQRAKQDSRPFAPPSSSLSFPNVPFSNNGTSNLKNNLAKPDEVHRPAESLDELIGRYEQEALSAVLRRCTDETRQRTTQAVEAQMQSMWERERAVWLKEIIGSHSLGGLGSSASAGNASKYPGLNERSQVALLAATPFGSEYAEAISSMKLDPAIVREHWNVVRGVGEKSITEIIAQLESVASDSLTRAQLSSSTLGYVSVWHLMSNLVVAPSSPFEQAKATLSHFCKQFQGTVTSRVRHASLAGQDTSSSYSNNLAAQCEAYSRLMTGNTDPWTVCFFCLRCGDAAAALQVLTSISQPSVHRILSSMALVQGNMACIWDQRSAFRLDSSDRRAVISLVDDNPSTDTSSNVYKKAVLSLLAANSPWPFSLEATEGLKTIEDYLMGSLWIVVLQTNPVDHLIELGETMMKLGSSYYDDPLSGGWSFALPLLATQQSQKALMWLAEAGGKCGLMQATHIGLVMSLAGIPIRNIGRGETKADGTLSSLLVAYPKNIYVEHGSFVALDYLVQIPNKVRLCKEVAMLIATSGEVDKLVGTLNAEGMRHNGALAKHCSEDEISIILVQAADRLSADTKDRKNAGAAVMSLMLAYRYADALSLMNSLVSPAYKPNEDRPFWLSQVAAFHTHYIKKRTNVLDVLERTGKSSLIQTSLILMDLNLFFVRLSNGNHGSECMSIAQDTQLLPSSISDCYVKQVEYRDLDPLLQDALPFLLVGVMEILSHDYSVLKRELHRDTSGVTRERLVELKEKAKLYTTFASSIGIESNQISRLTQILSLMT
jgi:Nup93/Nic96